MFSKNKIKKLEREIVELRTELNTMRYSLTFYMPVVNPSMFSGAKQLTVNEALGMIVNHFDLKYESKPEIQCLVSEKKKAPNKSLDL